MNLKNYISLKIGDKIIFKEQLTRLKSSSYQKNHPLSKAKPNLNNSTLHNRNANTQISQSPESQNFFGMDVIPKFETSKQSQQMKNELIQKIVKKKIILNKIISNYFSKKTFDFGSQLQAINSKIETLDLSLENNKENDHQTFLEMVSFINQVNKNPELRPLEKITIGEFKQIDVDTKHEILNNISVNKKYFCKKLNLNTSKDSYDNFIEKKNNDNDVFNNINDKENSKRRNTSSNEEIKKQINNKMKAMFAKKKAEEENEESEEDEEPCSFKRTKTFRIKRSNQPKNDNKNSNVNKIGGGNQIPQNNNYLNQNNNGISIRVPNTETFLTITEDQINLFKTLTGRFTMQKEEILSYFDIYKPKVMEAADNYYKKLYEADFLTLNYYYPKRPIPGPKTHKFRFTSDVQELIMAAQDDYISMDKPKMFIGNQQINIDKKVKCIGALNLPNNAEIKIFK